MLLQRFLSKSRSMNINHTAQHVRPKDVTTFGNRGTGYAIASHMKDRRRILFCDDNHFICAAASAVLKSEGHQVEVAVDGLDALEKIEARPDSFDLLITDICMPRLTGLGLVEKIRLLKIPMKVIIITALPSQFDDEVQNRLLIHGFLFKPFTARELLAILD
jgi:CheY-like chemotaxis protein